MNLKISPRVLVLAAAVLLWQSSNSVAAVPAGQSFASPGQAAAALQSALSAKDVDAITAIFGPGVNNLINPDRVQATNEFIMVANAMSESNRLVAVGEKRMILEYGREGTPFAVPLVEKGGRWQFDTEAGTDELINRRIGRNELSVLEAVRTYVQAQREYSTFDRDADEVLEYAQRIASTPGTKDGLFWSEDLDGTMSPLGPLVADAQAIGYRQKEQPQPFHGYYFRILTRQGKHAPGGAYDYIINGNMIGGFAMVAWPAEFDATGVMTFIVNQQGRVYQKNLGIKTGKIAASMKTYDRDSSWQPSRE